MRRWSGRSSLLLALLLLLGAAGTVTPGTRVEEFRLEQILVTSPASEVVWADGEDGSNLEYVTGRGRFYDTLGRPLDLGDTLRRGDVLYVAYRTSDPRRTVLSGVLKPREPFPATATETAGRPSGGAVRLKCGVSVAPGRGWQVEPEEDSAGFSTTGRLSLVLFEVADTELASMDELLAWQPEAAPEHWKVVGSGLLSLNQLQLAHLKAVSLLQWDRGFVWIHRETGKEVPAATPVHELNLVDVFMYRTTDGKLVSATSYIPVPEYTKRIKEVRTMVTSLRLTTD